MIEPRPDLKAEIIQALIEAQDLCGRLIDERHAAQVSAQRATLRAHVVENSIAFRLGSVLLDAVRSPNGVLALPGALITLVRDWRNRQKLPESSGDARPEVPRERPSLPGSDLVRAWHMEHRSSAPRALAELRIAAVVDGFTRACFSPDCRLLDLPAFGYERMIDDFEPHLLFVESAWRGSGGDWMHKINPLSEGLVRLVDACRRRGIPTVFWCKEDPSHFDGFIGAAAQFDHVFTTDLDCIERYRAKLGHERVRLLGFACQPRIHNPVEKGERKVAASFAGSWYEQYPERSKDFEELVAEVLEAMPVEIYDRNNERRDPAFEYPPKYRPMIRGGLPYERIDEAYKACEFAITVNTIKTSSTMFARRVHELLASNTITVSNYSRGLDHTFCDIVLMSGRDNLPARLQHLRDSKDARHRLRLRGLREVMTHHTAALRLAEIARVAIGKVAITEPEVHVIAQIDSNAELEHIVEVYREQKWRHKRLLLVAPEPCQRRGWAEDVQFVSSDAASAPVSELVPNGVWLAPWHAQDYYGPCYLLDLMHATLYSDSSVLGKSTCFVLDEGRLRLDTAGVPYRDGSPLRLRSSILQSGLLHNRALLDVLAEAEAEDAVPLLGLAVDEFGYCRFGAGSNVSMVDVE